jgi:hypothetical protein
MKKIIAMLLVLTMAMGLVACGTTNNTPETTEAKANVPTSALEILETIWNGVPEDNRFFAMGGDMNNVVDGAPGAYSLEDEGLTATLLVPADQIANLDEAASLVHGMMLNNFTCGAFHMAEGADAAAFADTMYNTISNNPWMCGMPEKMLIAVVGGEYVLVAFGINDAMAPVEASFAAAYADAEVKYNEAIAG